MQMPIVPFTPYGRKTHPQRIRCRKTYAKLGFTSDTVTEYAYPNGNCVMKRPQVTSLKGDGFGITVRYTVVFPIKWNGNAYKSLEVPITVSSYYKCK